MHQELAGPAARLGQGEHVLLGLVGGPSTGSRVVRRVLGGLLVLLGAASLLRATQSLGVEYVYMKDFVQDYLWVRAVLAGVDPYRDITELALQFFGFVPLGVFPHPNAHPPTIGLLMLPLAWVDYQTASAVWLALDFAFVLVAVFLMGVASGSRLSVRATALVGVALMAWYPFHKELVLGQLSTLVLLLLCGAWLSLQKDRRGLAGALLGLAIVIKPVPWPLLLVLLVRKEWRALGGAVAAMGIAGLLTLGVLGFDRLLTYQSGLRAVGELHRAEAQNMSITTVGWRVFHGTQSTILTAISAPPLVEFEPAARGLSLGLPALALALGCIAAARHRRLDVALAMMLCISLLISPISWDHYLVLAAFPAAILGGRIWRREESRASLNVAMLVALVLLLPVRTWMDLAVQVSGTPEDGLAVSFWAGLLTYVPSVGVAALAWLVRPESTVGAISE